MINVKLKNAKKLAIENSILDINGLAEGILHCTLTILYPISPIP